MRYITAEQFKEQSGEAQKVLLDWWEPSPGNLVYSKKYGEGLIKPGEIKGMGKYDLEILKERNIPLFTLQQLWEFIEDKYGSISISKDRYSGEHHICTLGWCVNEVGIIKDKDKLQAFWKCACEVARVIKGPQQMDREQLLKELDNYRYVPGHGPDYSKMSNEKLAKALQGHKAMFERAFGKKG